MTIIEALKKDEIARVSVRGRWMYWSNGDFEEQADCWVVRESRRGKSKIVIQVADEEEAVKWLLGQENDE